MRLVKVKESFYDLISMHHLEQEVLHNENGRPCVLLINLEYKEELKKFVVPLRSNISPRTPRNQYFPLPNNRNTRTGHHHGIHYIKLFPIKDCYIDRYRISTEYDQMILGILDRNKNVIINSCQDYLNECTYGNKHPMTPDIDGILTLL